MELHVKDEEGNIKTINVMFWSFFKCWILSYLSLLGILFVLGVILGFAMGSYI